MFEETTFESLFKIPQRNGLTKPSRLRGEGVKMVNMGELFSQRRIHKLPMDRVPCTDKELSQNKLENGDLLFARQSLTLEGAGKCSIFLGDEEQVVFESHLIRCRLDPEKTDPRYYFYLFESKFGKDRIGSIVEQVAAAGIRGSDLVKLRVFYPPLNDQQAIAHILGTLDDKIELNQKMNQTLEDIAKAIFKSWFVDFDPVRAKVEGRSTGLPDEISDLFPDELEESEIGEIPAGWKVSPLDSIGTFKNGLALQKYPPLEGLERLPVVKIAQLRKGSTIGDDTYASGVPDGFVIDDGDFVFSWSGTLMAKYWVGGRGALNQHLFKVEGQTQPLWMVAGWVEHFMPEFQSIAASKATTMGHIQREHLRQALCIIPPADVVDVCSAIITPIIERCVLAQQESKVLSELRDTLLPKLISGELRIPDAEKFLAEAGI